MAKIIRGTIDIYNMPPSASSAGVEKRCKRALVVSEGMSDFHFLEIVFLYQEHNVKMFTDIDETMRWLLNKEDLKS